MWACADCGHKFGPLNIAVEKDADRLQAIRAWAKGQVVICPPGTHGGEPGVWIVTFEDDARWDNYGSLAIDHKAETLDAAIDAAMLAAPDVGAA